MVPRGTPGRGAAWGKAGSISTGCVFFRESEERMRVCGSFRTISAGRRAKRMPGAAPPPHPAAPPGDALSNVRVQPATPIFTISSMSPTTTAPHHLIASTIDRHHRQAGPASTAPPLELDARHGIGRPSDSSAMTLDRLTRWVQDDLRASDLPVPKESDRPCIFPTDRACS